MFQGGGGTAATAQGLLYIANAYGQTNLVTQFFSTQIQIAGTAVTADTGVYGKRIYFG